MRAVHLNHLVCTRREYWKLLIEKCAHARAPHIPVQPFVVVSHCVYTPPSPPPNRSSRNPRRVRNAGRCRRRRRPSGAQLSRTHRMRISRVFAGETEFFCGKSSARPRRETGGFPRERCDSKFDSTNKRRCITTGHTYRCGLFADIKCPVVV